MARLIDTRINTNYRLYPNNYIAHDLRFGNKTYSDLYTQQEYDAFKQRLDSLEKYETCDIDRLKDIFLGIYSNPVDNK